MTPTPTDEPTKKLRCPRCKSEKVERPHDAYGNRATPSEKACGWCGLLFTVNEAGEVVPDA